MMKQILNRLRRDERGASAVEFAMLVPVLLLLLLGTVTLFDMFRAVQSVEKATFTVGDMMSRQTEMNQSQLNAMLTMMRQMVPTASDGGLRVSSISKIDDEFVLNWTRNVGSNVPDTDLPIEIIPDIAEGDSVLLTESFVPHAVFADLLGLGSITFSTKAAHRPRIVAAMAFQ